MSAEVHSETELYRVESRRARKLVWSGTLPACSVRHLAEQIKKSTSRVRTAGCSSLHAGSVRSRNVALQPDHLRGVNVLARANLTEQLLAWGRVEIQYRERGTASLISAE